MLPIVEFCGLEVTRLIIGANPFGGFSHQNEQRDKEMATFHSKDQILETWNRARRSGINTMITNNETEHVLVAVKEYLLGGERLQWIAQVANCRKPDMFAAIDQAVEIGCSALYFHGGQVDQLFADRNKDTLISWCEYARSARIPIGVAAHNPSAHLWVNNLGVVDFHVVCFFNCGSLHYGQGEVFRLADMTKAVECIRQIRKPCIGYKIMGAGRIDPRMAFEYAYENIKPGDVVNVGMHRGDNDDMVEENAAMVRQILSRQKTLNPTSTP